VLRFFAKYSSIIVHKRDKTGVLKQYFKVKNKKKSNAKQQSIQSKIPAVPKQERNQCQFMNNID
jgi:hypothetical protein